MDARNRMLERNRRAQAPEYLQLQYATDAIRDARGALKLADVRARLGEKFFSFDQQVSRAVDRFYDDRLSPEATVQRERAQLVKYAAQVRSEVERLIAELTASLDRGDAGLADVRERLESATARLERIVNQ